MTTPAFTRRLPSVPLPFAWESVRVMNPHREGYTMVISLLTRGVRVPDLRVVPAFAGVVPFRTVRVLVSPMLPATRPDVVLEIINFHVADERFPGAIVQVGLPFEDVEAFRRHAETAPNTNLPSAHLMRSSSSWNIALPRPVVQLAQGNTPAGNPSSQQGIQAGNPDIRRDPTQYRQTSDDSMSKGTERASNHNQSAPMDTSSETADNASESQDSVSTSLDPSLSSDTIKDVDIIGETDPEVIAAATILIKMRKSGE